MFYFEYMHSLAFSDRENRASSFVFQTVNSTFRSIIRQFSTKVNNRKTSRFPGVQRMVNSQLKTDCFLLLYLRFPVTKQRVDWCLLEFSLIYFMMTARLTHGIQVVFQYFSELFQLQNNAFTWVFREFSCIFSNRECAQNAKKPPVLHRSLVG